MFEVEAQPVSTAERVIVRFGATFVANFIRAGLSFLTALVIARGLGASEYGNLNFLLGSFAAVSQLLEMGTSSAFYTFISRKRRGPKFFALYGGWMVFQFIATVIIVGLLLPRGVIDRVWVGHDRGIVLLAFAASFLMTQAWGMLSQLGEAVRKTMIIQVALVSQAIGHLVLIAAAAYWGWLTVQTVMWLLIAEYILFVVVFGPRLMQANLSAGHEGREDVRMVAKEFTVYCTPLVIYGWVGFLYVFADRWLLQEFGGAQQQGFFAVGQQFANISLIATASILKVFWKEVAEARERQDHQRVRRLYDSLSRGLYFASAWISCLFIPYSREILKWTLGPSYEAAWLTLGLMFLYPIYQSLGQITGTFFYATGDTGRYAKVGLLMMGVSIPVTYLLLASPSAVVPGLGLAAVGLALKLVVLASIGVNLQVYLITKVNGWEFEYSYQVVVLACLLGLGWLCKWGAGQGLGISGLLHGGQVGVMILGGSLYAVLSLALLYRSPWLAGLTRNQILLAISSAARRLRLVDPVSSR
jgi:O-antigen/teichoic acid export membrane protein